MKVQAVKVLGHLFQIQSFTSSERVEITEANLT